MIRDHNGCWVSGFQISLGIGEILVAESWGLFYGLKLASQLNISYLEIESDSAILVQLSQKSDLSKHPLGSLLTGCLNIMKCMAVVSFIHIFREANMTADSLAKESINHEKGLVIFYSPPIHASQSFLDDLAAVTRTRRVSCFSS